MIYSEAAIVTTFGGVYFEVLVWRTAIPTHHRAFFRVREESESVVVFANCFDATADQLLELARLAKTAASLVEFLNEGGSVDNWRLARSSSHDSAN